VVQALECVCRKLSWPKPIRVDQGSELISREIDLWAYQKGVDLDFSRAGKPVANAFIAKALLLGVENEQRLTIDLVAIDQVCCCI